jgi:hypothetical protein
MWRGSDRPHLVRVLEAPGGPRLMATTPDAQRGINPAASPRMDAALHLSPRTLVWLAEHPLIRKVVHSVWDKLTELERAGHHPDTLDALRRVLAEHSPTPAGRCRACPRWRGRRRRFPCIVWHEIRGQLLGLFPWRQPAPPLRLRTQRP